MDSNMEHHHQTHGAMLPSAQFRPLNKAPTMEALSTEVAASFLSSLRGTQDFGQCLIKEQQDDNGQGQTSYSQCQGEGQPIPVVTRAQDHDQAYIRTSSDRDHFHTTDLYQPHDLDGYDGPLTAAALLRSSDPKVVAAAKRIFFTATKPQGQTPSPAGGQNEVSVPILMPQGEETQSVILNQAPSMSTSTYVASFYQKDQFHQNSSSVNIHPTVGTSKISSMSAVKPQTALPNYKLQAHKKQRLPPTGISNILVKANHIAIAAVKKKSASLAAVKKKSAPSPRRITIVENANSEAETVSAAISLGQTPTKLPDSLSPSPTPDKTEKAKRERNRIHARKTRQRKKERVQCLRECADELKEANVFLRLRVKNKQTADILLVLGGESGTESSELNKKVEILLKRPPTDISDLSKIQDLPALSSPPGRGKKRKQEEGQEGDDALEVAGTEAEAGDDINYALLQKDTSQCSPKDLELIRKERNRMHAKRTRYRKRIFMEKIQALIETLEEENQVLQEYMNTTAVDMDHYAPPQAGNTISLVPSQQRTQPVQEWQPSQNEQQQQMTRTAAEVVEATGAAHSPALVSVGFPVVSPASITLSSCNHTAVPALQRQASPEFHSQSSAQYIISGPMKNTTVARCVIQRQLEPSPVPATGAMESLLAAVDMAEQSRHDQIWSIDTQPDSSRMPPNMLSTASEGSPSPVHARVYVSTDNLNASSPMPMSIHQHQHQKLPSLITSEH